MLPGYVNQLLLAFKYYSTGQVVRLLSLTKNHSFPVVGAHSVTGRNVRPAIVFTLQSDYGVTLQIYLPRLCIDVYR
jgi:hypothetical protein